MPEQRGADGAPLPPEAVVFRLGESLNGKIPEQAFRLSSEDRKQIPPKLSVWDKDQTTPPQAHELMGKSPRYALAGYMPVVSIRSVVDGAGGELPLDVVWDHDDRLGAGGHCGVVGLDGPDTKQAKERRAQLRRILADLANERVTPIC